MQKNRLATVDRSYEKDEPEQITQMAEREELADNFWDYFDLMPIDIFKQYFMIDEVNEMLLEQDQEEQDNKLFKIEAKIIALTIMIPQQSYKFMKLLKELRNDEEKRKYYFEMSEKFQKLNG